MSKEDDTHPGIKQKLAEANAKADPWADKWLGWLKDSAYTVPLVVVILILLVAAGKWLL